MTTWITAQVRVAGMSLANNHIQVTGIILSAMSVKDYDRRVTILTKERGKLSAFANGVRRPGNSMMGITQAGIFAEFIIYEGRQSNEIKEIRVKDNFSEIYADGVKALYLMYFCEVAAFMTREGNDERDALRLLYTTSRALSKGLLPEKLIKAVYEIKMIYINGEGPLLDECVSCHGIAQTKYFSIKMHGMVCEKCATQLPYSERTLLTDSTWYSLWFIATTPPERLYTFKVSDEVLEELSTIGEKYLTYSTNHKFSGAEMLALF